MAQIRDDAVRWKTDSATSGQEFGSSALQDASTEILNSIMESNPVIGVKELVTRDIPNFCGEAWNSFKYSAVQSPYNGISQLVHRTGYQLPKIHVAEQHPDSKTWSGWLGQEAGKMCGVTADFMLLGKLTRLAKLATGTSALAEAAQTVSLSKTFANSALLGASFDFFTKPIADQEQYFWTARLRNAAIGGLTFGTLAGATRAGQSWLTQDLDRAAYFALPTSEKFLLNGVVGGICGLTSGIPAGLVNAQATALLNHGESASWKEIGKSILDFSISGGLLGVVHGVSETHAQSVALKQMHNRLLEHGQRELTRWGYGDVAKELINKQSLLICNENGYKYDGIYNNISDKTKINPEYIFNNISHPTSILPVVSHELRHRIDCFKRTALKLADPQGFRNAMVDEIVQDFALGGKRQAPLLHPSQRLTLTSDQSAQIQEALGKFLKSSSHSQEFGKEYISKSEVQDWLHKNNLGKSFNKEMVEELQLELYHANQVMRGAILPDELLNLPDNKVLKDTLTKEAERLRRLHGDGSLENHPKMTKALQNISASTTGRGGPPEYYLFSIEEIRARRQEESSRLRILAEEIKSELRKAPEDLRHLLHQRQASPSAPKLLAEDPHYTQSFYTQEIKANLPDLPLDSRKTITAHLDAMDAIKSNIFFLNKMEKLQAQRGSLTGSAEFNQSLEELLKSVPIRPSNSLEMLTATDIAILIGKRFPQPSASPYQSIRIAPTSPKNDVTL